jgi:hypothetical protein
MDLTTIVPERNALHAEQAGGVKLCFAMKPFVLPTGKFINILLPDAAKPPAFLLKDHKLGWGWSDKFRTISIPAPLGTEARALGDRLEALARKAAVLNAQEWFGKGPSVVGEAITVKSGIRETTNGDLLVLKAPSQDEDPVFYDANGAKVASDVDTRGCIADVLLACNGLFIRGMEVFVQLKCIAVALKTEPKPGARDLSSRLTSFTLVD